MEDALRSASIRLDPFDAHATLGLMSAIGKQKKKIAQHFSIEQKECYCYNLLSRNQSHCVDVNECRTNNGGCSQDCINTRGAYHCTCSDQYYLETDGRTCIELPPRCSRVHAPEHGEIECIQNLDHPQQKYREQEDEALIAENGRGDLGASGRSSNRSHKSRTLYNSGSTCVVRCNKGYKLVGDSTISCDRSGHWLGEPATCIRKYVEFHIQSNS